MMIFFFQILLNGIATGAIYALIAVGYSVTFTTMRVLNFGLGMWVMLGGMMTYSLYAVWGLNIVVTMIVIVAILGLLGVVAERVTVRPFVKAGSEAWVMATLAVGLLFVDVAELIWGRNSLAVPAFVGQEVLRFGPFGVYPQQLLIIAATIAAFIPARSAARVPILSALAGRRPLGSLPRRLVGSIGDMNGQKSCWPDRRHECAGCGRTGAGGDVSSPHGRRCNGSEFIRRADATYSERALLAADRGTGRAHFDGTGLRQPGDGPGSPIPPSLPSLAPSPPL